MAPPKSRLGRGLDSLVSADSLAPAVPAPIAAKTPTKLGSVQFIPVDLTLVIEGQGDVDLVRQQGVQIPVRGLGRIPSHTECDAPPTGPGIDDSHGLCGDVVRRHSHCHNPGACRKRQQQDHQGGAGRWWNSGHG